MNYQVLQLYKSVSEKFFNYIKEIHLKEFNLKNYTYQDHPKEDSLYSGKRYPVFCVADGVTLEPKKGKRYPNPSGAFLVANKFVQTFVRESEKKYNNFSLVELKQCFKKGNYEVKKLNEKYGRVKAKLNYLDFDLFTCTSALGVIKEDKLYLGTVCDSFVVIFDKKGKQKFISPDGWRFMEFSKHLEGKQRTIYIHKNLRNGFKRNKKIGYGVISGEQKALKYLDCGIEKLEDGDLILIGTDGYEEYIKLKKFINLFVRWSENVKYEVAEMEKELIRKNCIKYGHERTLFVVKVYE